MKTIIFDFNRTLLDPDSATLYPGVSSMLQALRKRGYVLHLVSRLEPTRTQTLQKLGITDYFSRIALVEDKDEVIHQLVNAAEGETYVVGDRLHDEIRSGNRAGARTIHVKQGTFSYLEPEGEHDRAWQTVENISQAFDLLLK